MNPRRPRQLDPGFLRFIRAQACCLCGTRQRVEAAHIRMADAKRDKPMTGMQIKPDDRFAVPLCAREHREAPDSQHRLGDEGKFWRMHEINPFALADAYYVDYRRENPNANPPYVRKLRSIKPRKPRDQRQKIPSRPFPKSLRSD